MIVRAGDVVKVGGRDDDFPGWLWCEDESGMGAWAPESYLAIEGNKGIFKRDYNSFELDVDIGEELLVLDEESGWCRCERENGETGWLPIDKVKII
jgi:hypothetical protein